MESVVLGEDRGAVNRLERPVPRVSERSGRAGDHRGQGGRDKAYHGLLLSYSVSQFQVFRNPVSSDLRVRVGWAKKNCATSDGECQGAGRSMPVWWSRKRNVKCFFSREHYLHYRDVLLRPLVPRRAQIPKFCCRRTLILGLEELVGAMQR
jgi:hypothetical protein